MRTICAGQDTSRNHEQSACDRDAANLEPDEMTFTSGGLIVAKNDTRSRWQAAERDPQRIAHSLVGHQPGVSVMHPLAIARGMTEPIASAAYNHDLAAIKMRIAHAAGVAGRKQGAVTLIAVSKTQTADRVEPLLTAGHRDFGENRVTEAQEKWPALRERYPDIQLHLIGRLQSNKATDAVAIADTLHAVDRLSLVTALARAMDAADRRPACFVQVNIGAEPQKGGCTIADLPRLLEAARDAALPVVGLMCLPPVDVEPAPYFALLAKLARDEGFDGLSMGMSADFETAVMIGATHVRVGRALFGARR